MVIENLVRSAICPIYAQWGLNLARVAASRISGSPLSVPETSSALLTYFGGLNNLAREKYHHQETLQE